jgi:hypothetical protein
MPKEDDHLRSTSDAYPCLDPTTMQMLDAVMEDALRELKRRGSPMATNEPLARELLAHRVMARATRGDLDPQRLKEHALWGLLN